MAQAYLDFEIEKKEKENQKNQTAQEINQAIEDLLGSQLDQSIFLDDNDKIIGEVKKPATKKRKYSTTKVKTRNLLTNLSYKRINRLDFDNKSYVLDILTFIIQYLNIFLIDIKLETEYEKNMLMFIWQKCLPSNLTNFVSTKYNYDTLTKKDLKFKDVYVMIHEYMSKDDNYNQAQKMLKSNFDEIRYVFSILFPKIYSRTNEIGIQIKSRFDYSFSLWSNNLFSDELDKGQQLPNDEQVIKKQQGTGKNMRDYEDRVFINEFEQKPLKNDLIDIIEVIENEEKKNKEASQKKETAANEIEVKKEEELNSFVKKVKPMNEVKKKFVEEREKRKHAKLMKKKKDLEEQLKRNTEQHKLLKPVIKKSKKKKLIK